MISTMKKRSIIISICALIIVIAALYLPFYEGYRTPAEIRANGNYIIDIYQIPELGKIAVFNGFHSFPGIVNLVLALVQIIAILFFPKEISVPITIVSLFGLTLLIVALSTVNGFNGGPFSDKMLIGFYLLIMSIGLLITYSFFQVNHLSKKR